MPNYHRFRIEGGLYFFTLVTYQRQPLFTNDLARATLRQAWRSVQMRLPFSTVAICLLPDHLHCLWKLPEGDANYSLRWSEIKRRFSKAYRLQTGFAQAVSPSRQKRGEAGIWQRRFWEHWIRDEADLQRHFDYIHYNPVKHGLVERVEDWRWSSFHRYMQMGYYPQGPTGTLFDNLRSIVIDE